MIVPTETLVKYDNPVLISKNTDKKVKPKGDTKQGTVAVTGSGGSIPGLPKSKISPADSQKNQQTEEILNSILPPREWSEEGQLWKQCVSSTPATRLDVMNLQEQLDTKLQQRQARETGICPVRRELYSQCFDEIIRQVTINCAERGILLLKQVLWYYHCFIHRTG
jgi:dynein light intermediate chain